MGNDYNRYCFPVQAVKKNSVYILDDGYGFDDNT